MCVIQRTAYVRPVSSVFSSMHYAISSSIFVDRRCIISLYQCTIVLRVCVLKKSADVHVVPENHVTLGDGIR